jgi:hypothetical protein
MPIGIARTATRGRRGRRYTMTRTEIGSSPRPLVARLGVRPGMSVAMVGVDDAHLLTTVRQCAGTVTTVSLPLRVPTTRELPPLPGLGAHRDLVFFQAASAEMLALFPRLVSSLQPDGALWVLVPKGRREVGESAVIAAGLTSEMVDVATVGVSERLSALKFVRRHRARSGRR